MGSLNVLNVGAGDIALNFNHLDEAEAEKAVRMLKDMQARGYAILVRLDDDTYVRAIDIDASRGRYLIQLPESMPLPAGAEEIAATDPALKKRRGRPPGRRVSMPIERAHATGIARSAGG